MLKDYNVTGANRARVAWKSNQRQVLLIAQDKPDFKLVREPLEPAVRVFVSNEGTNLKLHFWAPIPWYTLIIGTHRVGSTPIHTFASKKS